MADCTPYTVSAIDGDGDNIDLPSPPPALSPVDVNVSGGFPIILFPAVAGEFTRIYRVMLVVDADTVITFLDGATPLPGTLKCVAGEQIVLDPGMFPYWQGSTNTNFKMNSSNAVQITGAVWGFQNDS